MKYLVVCDHLKTIIDCASSADARTLFGCTKCLGVSRAYVALPKDIEMLASKQREIKRVKYRDINQLDWVG